MKRLFTILVLALGLNSAFSQSIQNEQKLIDHLGQERFEKLSQANSPSLTFMDNRVSYGYEILTMETEKLVGMNQVDTFIFTNADKSTYTISAAEFINQAEDGSLNILQLKLKYHSSANTFYRIGSTNKVLMLKSVEFISKQ